MMSVHIDIAGRGDTKAVLALVEELLNELGAEGQEFAGVDRAALAATLSAKLSAELQDGPDAPATGRDAGLLALLARDADGTPVGVLTLSRSFAIYAGGEYGVIDEMYVRPQWRGRGVGQALMRRALELARARGWRRLDVTTPVDDQRFGAPRFYSARGFEPAGEKLRILLDD